MRGHAPPPIRQRGVALLTAILLVALGTILAATMAYETAMTAQRAQATFAFDQSLLIAEAGEALAAYALVQSRKQDQQHDAKGQLWSMPYGPVEIVPGVTLLASLEDMQGRFNLNNLVKPDGGTDPAAVTQFENLLQLAQVEPKWASMIADWIDGDSVANGPDGAEDSTYLSQVPPYRAANRQITSASELLALPGFGRDRYLRIIRYVTALPTGSQTGGGQTSGKTLVNLCTAQRYVLDALVPTGERNFSAQDDESLEKQRMSGGCFPTPNDFKAAFASDPNAAAVMGQVSTQSDYFRLTSVVSVGTMQFSLYSLLKRENGKIHVIQRTFTAD
jgi:type II secretory pathway component PulK